MIMRGHRRGRSGFTLIEVLVAMAIFGVLSVLAYMAIGETLGSAEYLGQRMDRLKSIQRTVRLLSMDLMQTAPRPVRDPFGESTLPALRTDISSEFALELTHGGWPNPAGMPRGTLQRSAYRLEDGELVRYHWTVLDATLAMEPIQTVLLEDVDSLLFRYLQNNGEWTEQWPPLNASASGPALQRLRPRAAEIVLELRDEGEIRRIVEIAP